MRPESSKVDATEAPVQEPVRRRISGAEWDRLVAEGFFGEDERLELVHGEIRVMSPVGGLHDVTVTLISDLLRRALKRRHHVREEKTIVIGENRLVPDVMVVRGDVAARGDLQPEAAHVVLVVEVAESTLVYDRGEKSEIYARAGIAEYWIVDLVGATLTVRQEPQRRRGVYAIEKTLSKGLVRAPATTKKIDATRLLAALRRSR
jgi:Uma2 family endonuclease